MESTGVIREVLRDKRGITDETLRKYVIGWDNERVTIPIYDEHNELVNIRLYKWNSFEGGTKMINYDDKQGNSYGEDRIYGIENLFNESVTEVLWCEGEWDRLVAQQIGIPACTATAGADNFKSEWFKLIKKKKRIYICYDNDDAGKRATEYLIDNLRGEIEIFVVNWPANWRDKGDVTDILIADKYTNFLRQSE
jgi:DNA primase